MSIACIFIDSTECTVRKTNCNILVGWDRIARSVKNGLDFGIDTKYIKLCGTYSTYSENGCSMHCWIRNQYYNRSVHSARYLCYSAHMSLFTQVYALC